jgi:hypothetical protein
MTTKTWGRNMGRLGIDSSQDGLVAGYNMVPRADGTIEDLSGNGNHGTINGPGFEFTEIGPSMRFDGVDDDIEVIDSPSLEIADDLTLSLNVKTTDTSGNLIGKWTTLGDQRSFSLYLSSGKPTFIISSDGTSGNSESKECDCAVNTGLYTNIVVVFTKATNSVSFYVDKNLINTETFSTTPNGIFNSTANLKWGTGVGGTYTGSNSFFKYITRALTPAEIQAEYQRGAHAVNFKTDYGVTTTVTPDTSGELANSPFRVESGSFDISTDTINGCEAKVIECVSAGVCHIPTAYFHGNDTQGAYGTWEFWINKAASGATAPDVAFIGNQNTDPTDAGFNGYSFRISPSERFQLYKYTNGTPTVPFQTTGGAAELSTWYKVKFTRSSEGEFTGYVDDILIDVTTGTGSGTNPITDNTFTESKYIVLDLDAGDKIAYATKNGECSIVKYQGVV